MTLIIRKFGNKNFIHFWDSFEYGASDLISIFDGDYIKLRSNFGRIIGETNGYRYDDVSLYDETGSNTEETFTSIVQLAQRLIDLGYPAFYENGDLPPFSLNDNTDVDISTPTNGQILKYNSTTEKWENEDDTGGGGGSSEKQLTTYYAILSTAVNDWRGWRGASNPMSGNSTTIYGQGSIPVYTASDPVGIPLKGVSQITGITFYLGTAGSNTASMDLEFYFEVMDSPDESNIQVIVNAEQFTFTNISNGNTHDFTIENHSNLSDDSIIRFFYRNTTVNNTLRAASIIITYE
jgi:hypothetical protein